MDFPKIISAQQTQNTDAYSIQALSISSIDLMEQASQAFVNAMVSDLKGTEKIGIFCGCGNNGGDGFAIARLLIERGFAVEAFLIQIGPKLSNDCALNMRRLASVKMISEVKFIPNLTQFDVIIDALFGSGLSRPIREGLMSQVISYINQSKAKVYSVDIPSGLFCDHVLENPTAVCADITISFQRPKLAFFFPEYGQYIKKWKVIPIGLDEEFIQQQESHYFMLDKGVSKLIKRRNRYSHKGTYGHVLLIAGSYGKIGAAVLCTKATLRSGAGLVTAYLPKCGYEILQTAVPEAMCLTDQNAEYIIRIPPIESYSAIGIGPGIGTHQKTKNAVKELLKIATKPLVLDADALNILSEKPSWLHHLPKNSILTPHIKEFDRLAGPSKDALDRYNKQLAFSKKYHVIVILKDAHTSICDPTGKLYFNTTGNPGMATAGSGDVLTGIITGLLAQGYAPIEAAIIGVYFHGKAGDKIKNSSGEYSLTASDLIKGLFLV